jgi:hypothetical protein
MDWIMSCRYYFAFSLVKAPVCTLCAVMNCVQMIDLVRADNSTEKWRCMASVSEMLSWSASSLLGGQANIRRKNK